MKNSCPSGQKTLPQGFCPLEQVDHSGRWKQQEITGNFRFRLRRQTPMIFCSVRFGPARWRTKLRLRPALSLLAFNAGRGRGWPAPGERSWHWKPCGQFAGPRRDAVQIVNGGPSADSDSGERVAQSGRSVGPAKRLPNTRRRQRPHDSGVLQDRQKRSGWLNVLQPQGSCGGSETKGYDGFPTEVWFEGDIRNCRVVMDEAGLPGEWNQCLSRIWFDEGARAFPDRWEKDEDDKLLPEELNGILPWLSKGRRR